MLVLPSATIKPNRTKLEVRERWKGGWGSLHGFDSSLSKRSAQISVAFIKLCGRSSSANACEDGEKLHGTRTAKDNHAYIAYIHENTQPNETDTPMCNNQSNVRDFEFWAHHHRTPSCSAQVKAIIAVRMDDDFTVVDAQTR